jgi:ABC-type dipeptide/oligopeptide/nickel transport system permease component
VLTIITDTLRTTHPLAAIAFILLVVLGVWFFVIAMISKDERKWHDTYAREINNAYKRMNDGKSNRS